MNSIRPELAQMIGNNVRRIRGDQTMEQIAKVGRRLGFKWSSGSIAALEKGEARITLETLAGLCIALAREDKDESTLPLSELIRPDEEVALLPPISIPGINVLEWLGG